MSKAVELLKSVGISVESQVAKRADWVWFKRLHDRDPRWGWKWTRWTRCPEPTRWDSANGWDSFGYIEGCSTYYGPAHVRLPNG